MLQAPQPAGRWIDGGPRSNQVAAVLVDQRPVRRWVRVLAVIMVVTVLVGANYAGLADKGLGFAALGSRPSGSTGSPRPGA
jgi:hypothetical protein